MKGKTACTYVLLSLVLIAVWTDLGACSQYGVKVVVNNDGSKSVTDLQVVFTGGKESLQILAGGMSHEFIINPDAESAIDLRFRTSDGVARSTKLDIYLGKNYEGKIEVHIASDGTVKVNEIAPPRPRTFGLF